MARIRSIKPELRTSLTAADWPREVRYFWTLLWGYLDDHGRGIDEPRLVKADCFPLDDDLSAATMDLWLGMFAASESLCRYTVAGRRYMHATNWSHHQKPSHPAPSRIPPCPHHEAHKASPEELQFDSGNPPEDDASSTRSAPDVLVPEQLVVDGAGSSRKNSSSSADAADGHPPKAKPRKPPGFDAFWAAYPRKVGKDAARKAWTKAIARGAAPELVIAGAGFYALERKLQDPQYTKHPATWLNAGCWQDEADPAYTPPAISAPSEAVRHPGYRPYAEVLAEQERYTAPSVPLFPQVGMSLDD